MKAVAIILVLLISSSFAIDLTGYKAVPQDQIKDLRRVLSDGIKACLKVALDTGRLGPSNYHLDKVNQFLYQDVADGVDYYLSIYASDNNNADNSGTIEGLFSLKTNEKLHLLDYAIGEDWPVYVAPAAEDASL